MKKREYQIFNLLFITAFFAFGLFYEYMACIYCALFGLLYFTMSMRRKKLVFYANPQSLILGILVLMYLISCVYAVDAGMGWIGFLKNLTILFFLCCAMQLTKEERDMTLALIPAAGSAMTLIGVIAYAVKPIRSFFYTADRLGGFFQYANVFALFCLVGMILLTGKVWEKGRKELRGVQMFLLMAGIFLSGSRTVILLMFPVCVILAVRKKQWRIPLAVMLLAMFAGAGVYTALTGNMQNVGRFLTTSLQSSTFLGRLLYDKDGLRLLLHHPFGLGYLGYYFMEPEIQTGIYSVRYIHNDILQIALDIGIVPCILFVWVLGTNIFGRNREFEKRLTVAVIGLHCLLDFDLEFTAVWFLLLLALDLYRGKEINIAAGGKTAFYKIIALIFSVGSLYTGLAMLPRYFGNVEMAAAMLPFYTEAKTELLTKETDSKKAGETASELIKQNPYIAEAYDVLAALNYQAGDYPKMAEYKKRSVGIHKYDMENYERCIIMLSGAIENVSRREDAKLLRELMQDVLDVKKQLDETKRITDDLAYRIKDQPDFTLKREVSDYIEQVEQLLK